MKRLEDFSALQELAENNRPLWVFTTNQDVTLEILATKFGIPIKSGFQERVTLSINARAGASIDIDFERLPRAAIAAGDYDFFQPGEFGINLLKLHGALDIFGEGDEISYLKIAGKDGKPRSYVDQMQSLESIDLALGMRDCIRVNNEHSYLDGHGVVHYLRNSLLSGAHKFSPRMTQIAPPEFLTLFRGFVDFAAELVCIGYGFGDHHINEPIVEWLSQAAARRLTIINPGIEECPDRFKQLSRQVALVSKDARRFSIDLHGREVDPMRLEIRRLQITNRKRRMKKLLERGQASGE